MEPTKKTCAPSRRPGLIISKWYITQSKPSASLPVHGACNGESCQETSPTATLLPTSARAVLAPPAMQTRQPALWQQPPLRSAAAAPAPADCTLILQPNPPSYWRCLALLLLLPYPSPLLLLLHRCCCWCCCCRDGAAPALRIPSSAWSIR